MPVPLPDLDDLTFDDLTAEARTLLPVVAPAWTDHNPSDPGIALVELLAWLTEMLVFGVNQIPPAHTLQFLRLLGGPDWVPPPGASLDEAVDATMRTVRERYRAVTPDDHEYLVTHTWPTSPEAAELGAEAQVRRVRCVTGRDLGGPDPAADLPAHVSVVVVPPSTADDRHPQPAEALTTAIARFLAPRRLLTTRQHVVGPGYVDLAVAVDVALHPDSPPDDALAAARDVLVAFFDPQDGGMAGTGWPFGRMVHVSEVYAVLERSGAVDFVDDVRLTGADPIRDDDGRVVGIPLDDHELVRLTRVDLQGFDAHGRPHPLTWTAAP